jgi:hypothetical protein
MSRKLYRCLEREQYTQFKILFKKKLRFETKYFVVNTESNTTTVFYKGNQILYPYIMYPDQSIQYETEFIEEMNQLMTHIMLQNDTQLIKFVLQSGFKFNSEHMLIAAKNGNIQVLNEFYYQGYEIKDSVISTAMINNRVKVILWALEHVKEISNSVFVLAFMRYKEVLNLLINKYQDQLCQNQELYQELETLLTRYGEDHVDDTLKQLIDRCLFNSREHPICYHIKNRTWRKEMIQKELKDKYEIDTTVIKCIIDFL